MPRHSPDALFRLNFLLLFVLFELSEFHFEHGYFTLREKAFYCLLECFPPCLQFLACFGEIVVNYPNIGKTLNISIDLVI